MLKVTYSMHIVCFWERLLNTSEVKAFVNCTEFKRILSKSNTLTDPLKFEQKGKNRESVHFDPSSVSMCITILVLGYSM